MREFRRAASATLAGITAIAIGLAAPAPAFATEPTATVVEFYNASLGHYFITASAAEAAMLDAGIVVPGWKRTGVQWSAWLETADSPDAVDVCRFFGTPGVGPNSHFYTVDAAECEHVKQDPHWTYEGIAFAIVPPSNGACGAGTQPIYRSFHPGAAVVESNHRFLPDLTMHYRMAATSILEGVAMCAPLSSTEIEADATRLLEQATFGPSDAAIEHVKAIGAAAYVDEQLALASTRYNAYPPVPFTRPDSCVDDHTLPVRADSYCQRDNYSLFQLQRQFFEHAVGAPDQLRQRVAFALSQILVTSGTEINLVYAMQRYQQLLADLAFDNYEHVLAAVTLSPAMGKYLDMANNRKATAGVQPNENYAREILQLFSIGTVELAADGTPLVDAAGTPIATYEQPEIFSFARVFTGWTYPTAPQAPLRALNPPYFDGAMEEKSAYHDYDQKLLLEGALAPANLTMSADLAFAIHDIFMHPNVGPFVCRQLIQKLVTGDPSPQYVARIAAVFANNGAGVRGDLAAVIRAILLDPEARGPSKLDPAYGRLREPAQFAAGALRALNGATDGVYLRAVTVPMGEPTYTAPSVFNFYPPDYVVPGTQANGPEFAIQNTSTALTRANFVNTVAFGTIAPDPNVYGATGTQVDFSALAAAADAGTLVDALDRLLLHHTMSAQAKSAIVAAVNAIPSSDASTRARTAFYLVASSSQYQVER